MKKIYCIVSFLLIIIKGMSQNRELDSIRIQLGKQLHDTSRLALMSKYINRAGQAVYQEYSKMMLDLAQKNVNESKAGSPLLKSYLNYLAEAYYFRGEDFLLRSDPQKAISSYEKCIEISIKTGNQLLAATGQMELAQALTMQKDYKKAIETLYKALKIVQGLNEQKTIGDIYKSIARIYRRQNNHEKAVELYNKSIEAYKASGFKFGMLDALYKLSYAYSEVNDSVQSNACILKTEDIINSMSENEKAPYQVFINSLLSKVYLAKGNSTLAIEYLTKTIEPMKKAGVLSELGFIYNALSDIYQKTNQYKKAIFYAEKAQEIHRETKHEWGLNNGYEKLYRLYKHEGNTKKALEMHELLSATNDSIQRKKDEKHVIEAGLKYEFEKKELLSKMAHDKKISELSLRAEKENSRKNTVLIILGACLLLFAGLACFLYYYFRQRSIIQNQKNNLLKQKLLLSQMNPHFIFNSLNAIQNYIFKKNVLEAGSYLSQFAEMIRMILDFSRKDYITLDSELKFLEHYLKLQQLRFENKFDFSLLIDDDIDTENTLLPPMMAQPFIENAIEHGIFHKNNKGKISVHFQRKGDELIYIIEDDGVGLKASEKLKPKFNKVHESLAIAITKERIQALYNTIKKPMIELIDKKDIDLSDTGVKVRFSVQFKEATL